MIFSSRPPPTVLVIYGDGDGDACVQYLRTAGFRVATASQIPHSAIVDRTLATMPDVILLDCHCDWETRERLKTDRRTAPIPVIALADVVLLPNSSQSSGTAPLDPDRLATDPQ